MRCWYITHHLENSSAVIVKRCFVDYDDYRCFYIVAEVDLVYRRFRLVKEKRHRSA